MVVFAVEQVIFKSSSVNIKVDLVAVVFCLSWSWALGLGSEAEVKQTISELLQFYDLQYYYIDLWRL